MAAFIRLHILCRERDAAAIQAACDLALPGEIGLAPSDTPGLWWTSGQWERERGLEILAALSAIPGLKVCRGPVAGAREDGVVVGKGAPAPRVEAQARRTVERAVEEWQGEHGESGNPHKPR